MFNINNFPHCNMCGSHIFNCICCWPESESFNLDGTAKMPMYPSYISITNKIKKFLDKIDENDKDKEIAELKAKIKELEAAKYKDEDLYLNHLLKELKEEKDWLNKRGIYEDETYYEPQLNISLGRLKIINDIIKKLEATTPKDDKEYEFKVKCHRVIRDYLSGVRDTNNNYYKIICRNNDFNYSCSLNKQDIQTIVITLQKVLDDGVLK